MLRSKITRSKTLAEWLQVEKFMVESFAALAAKGGLGNVSMPRRSLSNVGYSLWIPSKFEPNYSLLAS
jgi:hypothetical protein